MSIENEGKESPDIPMRLDRMSQRPFRVDAIPVATTIPLSFDVSALFEVGHDPLDCSFGDSDALRDIAEANPRILGQQEKHMRMVTEERP